MLVHIDNLYTYARFLLLKPADAEDAVHECYLKAIVNIGDRRTTTEKLWLLRILRMVCFREIAQHGDFTTGDHVEATVCANQACTTDLAPPEVSNPPSLDDGKAVQTFIASLPLCLREAIVLRECINLSYSEMVAVTGVSIAVVNKRLSRARTILLDQNAVSRNSTIGSVGSRD